MLSIGIDGNGRLIGFAYPGDHRDCCMAGARAAAAGSS
jgi:hypothetical protein